MSFIARTQANSTIFKAICQQQSRRFTVIAAQRKSPIDKTKEVAQDANLKAGQGADKILEKAEQGVNQASNQAQSVKGAYEAKGVKGATEKVGHDANIAAGEGLAKGIEAAETIVQKTKEAVGLGKKKAENVAGEVQKEASHISEKAQGKAEEVAGKARQTASDVKKEL